MSTSVASVVSHFPEAENGFTTTTAGSVSSGAVTVTLNSVAGYTNGEPVVLVIDPTDAAKKQTFTGIVDTSGVQITSVVWTAGTNQTHALGATVVDYATATHISMISKGIKVSHDQDGTLKAGAVDVTAVIADGIVTRAKLATAVTTELNDGWTTPTQTVSSVTNNGNRSYDVVFNSTVASVLSPGMRLRTTRTVTAPTQCADLEAGSSQYFNKTSPNGMTFPDDFVVSAWVKLESYPAAGQIIASRYNGTSGWALAILATGQPYLIGNNAGAANASYVLAYQSIPLNKWVHVTAQLDMSTFTATTTTSYIMLDGVDVPASVTRTGTNPTALVQAGNLEIGSWNGGLLPFDGKIAQVAIYSAKVTQANIRATISQGLSGSETSLISAYSFNNSINDLNANANNLTAQGGALATATDSPFGQDSNGVTAGTTDCALVMKVSTTTATVQVPEGCTIPTSGGVSAVAYSTATSPFGFTLDKGRWELRSMFNARSTKASPVNATTYMLGGEQISIPVGAWRAGYEALGYVIAGSGTNQVRADLNVTSATYSATSDFACVGIYANATTEAAGNMKKEAPLTLSSQTTYYLNAQAQFTGATNGLSFLHDFSKGVIYAIPAGV